MTAAPALPDRIVADRLPISVRVGVQGDWPLVSDSWLLSAREGDGHIEGPRFIRWQKAMQRGIAARPTARLLVAHPDEDPETIMGWLVWEAASVPVLHYLWVRFASRRLGIARMLLEASGVSPEREAIMAARPARVFEAGRWVSSPLLAMVPRAWKCMPRVQFMSVDP